MNWMIYGIGSGYWNRGYATEAVHWFLEYLFREKGLKTVYASFFTGNDDSLRRKVAKEWSELNGVEITPEMIYCVGCRIDGVKTPYCESLCPIRQCALERKVATCGSSGVMESCGKLFGILQRNGADVQVHLFEGRHNGEYVLSNLNTYLRFYNG